MKALAIDKGSVTRFIDIAEPDCPADHVLIRVERVGLCGSDLNTWRGLNPISANLRVEPSEECDASVPR